MTRVSSSTKNRKSRYKNLGYITSHILEGERGIGVAVVIFFLISTALFVGFSMEGSKSGDQYWWLSSLSIAGVPAAIGGLLLLRMRYLKKKRECFGRPLFVVDRRKGYIGCELNGFVELNPRLLPNELIRVRLECIHFVPRSVKSNGPQTSMEKKLWLEEYKTNVVPSPIHSDKQAIPISFSIPEDAQCTEGSKLKGIGWRVSVYCPRSGIDLWERFDVRVIPADKVLKSSGIMDDIGEFVRCS